MISIKFTVLFEDPFYVGIIEKNIEQQYFVCRIIFGSEPSDAEIYEFIKIKYNKLKFNYADIDINSKNFSRKKINPKRLQKIISKEQEKNKSVKKAKDSLKQSYEIFKEQKRFELKQLKKKEKKKGH